MRAHLRQAGTRRRHTLVLALTFVTGAVDAIGFVNLGEAFSSVMTGNMVLLGIRSASGDWVEIVRVGTAILAFVLGVLGGARIAGRVRAGDDVWPRGATVALAAEAVLLGVVTVTWIALRGLLSPEVQQVLLALCAAALGVQSSAVQRFGIAGLSSTYLTGTLTTLIGGVAARKPAASLLPSLLVLIAVVIGAGAGWVASVTVGRDAPLVALVPLLGILAVAALSRWTQPAESRAQALAAPR